MPAIGNMDFHRVLGAGVVKCWENFNIWEILVSVILSDWEGIPISTNPLIHSTRLTSHFLSSSWTITVSRNGNCFCFDRTLVFLGRGKKSIRSMAPSSWMYRVWRMFDDGRYCCLVVYWTPLFGVMLKYPPRSASRRRPNTVGESKSGLFGVSIV